MTLHSGLLRHQDESPSHFLPGLFESHIERGAKQQQTSMPFTYSSGGLSHSHGFSLMSMLDEIKKSSGTGPNVVIFNVAETGYDLSFYV